VDDERLSRLEYRLLTGRGSDATPSPVLEEAFRFWSAFWKDVYRSVGATSGPDPEDFRRQSYWSVLTDGAAVVALHGYTRFDLDQRADREHRYFRRYWSPETVAALRGLGVRHVMTMEYFSVSPEWRSKRLGMSLASVVAGLGVELARELGVDGIVSAARVDTGADRIGKAFGAETVATLPVNGVATELLLFSRERWHAHEDPAIRRWVRRLWQSRQEEVPLPRAA
jgi:hypothetical protein